LARSLSQVVRESLGESLATLDSALEGLEVGDTVDEVLRGRLQEVRDTLEDVLERSERGVEGERLRQRWVRVPPTTQQCLPRGWCSFRDRHVVPAFTEHA
jgi:hypothetical protein